MHSNKVNEQKGNGDILYKMSVQISSKLHLGVPSPCISICKMNEASGLCEGCLRTLDETADWSRLDDADKRSVWQRIDSRRKSKAPA